MNKIITFKALICIFICHIAGAQITTFNTVWDLTKSTGAGPNVITIGTATSGTASYTWTELSPGSASGSGSWSGTNLTITGLPANSVISLKIVHTNFRRININNGADRERLIEVTQWGSTPWTSMQNAFNGCRNLQVLATDVPILTGVTNMSSMFAQCTFLNSPSNINTWNTVNVVNMSNMFSFANAFNQNIGSWNTAKVTNMSSMFSFASAFNQNIGSWNTILVANMSNMFSFASVFNQNIGSWNTAKVTNMSNMFQFASSFNQPIGSWNTILVNNMSSMFNYASVFNQPIGTWNTGIVTSMSDMFADAFAFNQPLSSWNTALVSDMSNMFSNATSFNQPIGLWNLSAVSDMSGMLDNNGMDCISYSSSLAGWSGNVSTPNGLSLGANNRLYSPSIDPERTNLTTIKSWNINNDAANFTLPALVPTTQVVVPVTTCGDGIYVNPAILSDNVITFYKNANLISAGSLTINNQGTLTGGGGVFTNTASTYYQSTSVGLSTIRVSKRILSFSSPSPFPSGGVIARVYYSATDNNTIVSTPWPGVNPPISSGWFISSDNTAQSVVNAMTPNFLGNVVAIFPNASGVESGIDWVEFNINSYGSIGFLAKTGVPLPIRLLSFTADCKTSAVVLKWTTANETTNDYFTIERSLDKINWQTIKTVTGLATSNRNQNYSFVDTETKGSSNYYRLSQTDFDGHSHYFNVIKADCQNNSAKKFQVYPNPSVSGKFVISTDNATDGNLNITDVLGKSIYSAKVVGQEIKVDLSAFPNGLYYVKILSANGIDFEKLTISK